jgi:hypothetical protein
VEAITAYTTVAEELKQVRKRIRDEDDAKMAKRIKKNKDQRVWAIKQLIKSNRQADEPVRVKKVKKIKKKYIISIRVPWEAFGKINIKQ